MSNETILIGYLTYALAQAILVTHRDEYAPKSVWTVSFLAVLAPAVTIIACVHLIRRMVA